MKIGVLGLQGDFILHTNMLSQLGIQVQLVRDNADLADCKGLIIPGGESTTIGMLLKRRGLDRVISTKIQNGLPIFGTCAGLILLAKKVYGRVEVQFGVLDIEIERNAYGSQRESFELTIDLDIHGGGNFPAVFIRAPKIFTWSNEVQILARVNDSPVLLQQGTILASSFHPELTNDNRVHRYFINEFCADYIPTSP